MKNSRHKMIFELIGTYNIETQTELAQHLRERGFDVTQTTVSRDIKALKLVKVLSDNGVTYRYAASDTKQFGGDGAYKSLLSGVIRSVNFAQNLVVIHTIPGSAMLAAEVIDSLKWPEVVGTVSGYDTVMIALKSIEDSIAIKERIERLCAESDANAADKN